ASRTACSGSASPCGRRGGGRWWGCSQWRWCSCRVSLRLAVVVRTLAESSLSSNIRAVNVTGQTQRAPRSRRDTESGALQKEGCEGLAVEAVDAADHQLGEAERDYGPHDGPREREGEEVHGQLRYARVMNRHSAQSA